MSEDQFEGYTLGDFRSDFKIARERLYHHLLESFPDHSKEIQQRDAYVKSFLPNNYQAHCENFLNLKRDLTKRSLEARIE